MKNALAILYRRYGFPSQETRRQIETEDAAEGIAPICECAAKAPTFPVFRDNPHVPGCPYFDPDWTADVRTAAAAVAGGLGTRGGRKA